MVRPLTIVTPGPKYFLTHLIASYGIVERTRGEQEKKQALVAITVSYGRRDELYEIYEFTAPAPADSTGKGDMSAVKAKLRVDAEKLLRSFNSFLNSPEVELVPAMITLQWFINSGLAKKYADPEFDQLAKTDLKETLN